MPASCADTESYARSQTGQAAGGSSGTSIGLPRLAVAPGRLLAARVGRGPVLAGRVDCVADDAVLVVPVRDERDVVEGLGVERADLVGDDACALGEVEPGDAATERGHDERLAAAVVGGL